MLRWPVWIVLAVVAGLAVYGGVRDAAASREIAEASARLDVLAGSLHNELSRHEALPGVLALDARLGEALAQPSDAARVAAAHDYLREVGDRTGAEALFLMDREGLTIASSNAGEPDSFVGHNYGFRPYAIDAFATGFGRFYAVGVTSGRPGYFLAAAVRREGRVTGAVVMKVPLLAFESSLAPGGTPTVVADENGVTILASDAALRYRTLAPLTEAQRARIAATRQFDGLPLPPLDGPEEPAWSTSLPSLLAAPRTAVVRPVRDSAWRLVAYAHAPAAHLLAGVSGALALCLVAGTGLALHSNALRRQRRLDLRLREDEIQRRIEIGTRRLREQLAEQARTEALLRDTTDSAVQAGKLTVLGQMAAAMSHELNQPLTALRNFAENSITLLDHGRSDTVRANLGRIAQLAERMGQIVAQLRTHARKQPGPLVPVAVAPAIGSALQLLQAGLGRDVAVDIQVDPPDLTVLAQPVRLEQVLVNLLRNAIESQPCTAAPAVRAGVEADRVVIEVRDSGPGLSDEVMARLFEPFFTTKPSGQGLGLGLPVSRMILRTMNGDLTARPAEGGGAVFRIALPPATGAAVPLPTHGALA